MSFWLKQFAIAVATMALLPCANAHNRFDPQTSNWILQDIICVQACSSDFTASIKPYLSRPLGFGHNRPKFDLLDTCDGFTTLNTRQEKTASVIQQIKQSAGPKAHLDFSKLKLQKPELTTASVICHDESQNLSPEGDLMFKVISINDKNMVVWFENWVFLRFEAEQAKP